MAKSKQQKTKDLDEVVGKVAGAKSMVFTEFRGTRVKDVDTFRRTMEKEGIFTKVYKLTLLRKALAEKGVDTSSMDWKLPVVVSMSVDEETLPARIVKALSKDIKTISLLGGVVEGNVLSKAQVEALADMPSRSALRAQLVGTLNAPVSGFVNVLAGNIRGLINVLNAVAQKS